MAQIGASSYNQTEIHDSSPQGVVSRVQGTTIVENNNKWTNIDGNTLWRLEVDNGVELYDRTVDSIDHMRSLGDLGVSEKILVNNYYEDSYGGGGIFKVVSDHAKYNLKMTEPDIGVIDGLPPTLLSIDDRVTIKFKVDSWDTTYNRYIVPLYFQGPGTEPGGGNDFYFRIRSTEGSEDFYRIESAGRSVNVSVTNEYEEAVDAGSLPYGEWITVVFRPSGAYIFNFDRVYLNHSAGSSIGYYIDIESFTIDNGYFNNETWALDNEHGQSYITGSNGSVINLTASTGDVNDLWSIDPNSDNGFDKIELANGGVAEREIENRIVTPQMFGAKTNVYKTEFINDSSDFIQKAWDSSFSVHMPPGFYYITKTLHLTKSKTVEMVGGTSDHQYTSADNIGSTNTVLYSDRNIGYVRIAKDNIVVLNGLLDTTQVCKDEDGIEDVLGHTNFGYMIDLDARIWQILLDNIYVSGDWNKLGYTGIGTIGIYLNTDQESYESNDPYLTHAKINGYIQGCQIGFHVPKRSPAYLAKTGWFNGSDFNLRMRACKEFYHVEHGGSLTFKGFLQDSAIMNEEEFKLPLYAAYFKNVDCFFDAMCGDRIRKIGDRSDRYRHNNNYLYADGHVDLGERIKLEYKYGYTNIKQVGNREIINSSDNVVLLDKGNTFISQLHNQMMYAGHHKTVEYKGFEEPADIDVFPQNNAASTVEADAITGFSSDGSTSVITSELGDSSEGTHFIRISATDILNEKGIINIPVVENEVYEIELDVRKSKSGQTQVLEIIGFDKSYDTVVGGFTWNTHKFKGKALATGDAQIVLWATKDWVFETQSNSVANGDIIMKPMFEKGGSYKFKVTTPGYPDVDVHYQNSCGADGSYASELNAAFQAVDPNFSVLAYAHYSSISIRIVDGTYSAISTVTMNIDGNTTDYIDIDNVKVLDKWHNNNLFPADNASNPDTLVEDATACTTNGTSLLKGDVFAGYSRHQILKERGFAEIYVELPVTEDLSNVYSRLDGDLSHNLVQLITIDNNDEHISNIQDQYGSYGTGQLKFSIPESTNIKALIFRFFGSTDFTEYMNILDLAIDQHWRRNPPIITQKGGTIRNRLRVDGGVTSYHYPLNPNNYYEFDIDLIDENEFNPADFNSPYIELNNTSGIEKTLEFDNGDGAFENLRGMDLFLKLHDDSAPIKFSGTTNLLSSTSKIISVDGADVTLEAGDWIYGKVVQDYTTGVRFMEIMRSTLYYKKIEVEDLSILDPYNSYVNFNVNRFVSASPIVDNHEWNNIDNNNPNATPKTYVEFSANVTDLSIRYMGSTIFLCNTDTGVSHSLTFFDNEMGYIKGAEFFIMATAAEYAGTEGLMIDSAPISIGATLGSGIITKDGNTVVLNAGEWIKVKVVDLTNSDGNPHFARLIELDRKRVDQYVF